MPATPRRARRALRISAFLIISAAALGGCGTIGEAQNTIDRARLINDLASRLESAGEASYTAEYQLPGGATATIAQDGRRTAFIYPGGKLLLTSDQTAQCATRGAATTCTITPPVTPDADPSEDVLAAVAGEGLVPPAYVVNLLTSAALDSDAVVDQHDTTLAGQHATCIEVTGVDNADASHFSACVTIDGVLGSFTGPVGSTSVDITLSRYAPTVSADVFALPQGANVIDKRPGR